jgi:Type II secretion system (T2SS), protein E, N-terminal domain
MIAITREAFVARVRIGEILVRAGLLSEERLREVLATQRWLAAPLPIGRLLVSSGAITEWTMVRALGSQLNVEIVDLDALVIDPMAVELIDGAFCEEHGVMPLQLEGKTLELAMADTTWSSLIDELQASLGYAISPRLTGPEMLRRAVARYYPHLAHRADPAPTPATPEVVELRTKVDQQTERVRRLLEICSLNGVPVPDELV